MTRQLKKLIKSDMNEAAKLLNAYSTIVKDINTEANKRYTLYFFDNKYFGVAKFNGETTSICQYLNNNTNSFPFNLV